MIMRNSIVVLFALATVACSDRGRSGASPVVHDSAGVSLIELAGAPADSSSQLEEVRRIRGDGPGDAMLGDITDADMANDGRIYVLDGAARQVKVFAPDGTFERVIGRGGQGPGELSAGARSVLVGKDAIYVPDPPRGGIHVFGLDGEARDHLPLVSTGIPLGASLDGSGRVITGVLGVVSGRGGGITDSVVLVRATSASGTDTVGRLLLRPGSGPLLPVMYGAAPVFARLDNDRFVVGLTDRLELRTYDSNGTRLGIMRRADPGTPMSEADQDVILNTTFRSMDSTSRTQMVQRAKQQRAIASVYPAFARIVAGDDAIFVERVMQASDLTPARAARFEMDYNGSGRWDVYSDDGAFLRSFELPEGVRLARVRGDVLLASGFDAQDVPSVRVYRMPR